MAPVTRSVYRNNIALGSKLRAFGRVQRRFAVAERSSQRLAVKRWRRMANYTWENPRDFAKFSRRLAAVFLTWIRRG